MGAEVGGEKQPALAQTRLPSKTSDRGVRGPSGASGRVEGMIGEGHTRLSHSHKTLSHGRQGTLGLVHGDTVTERSGDSSTGHAGGRRQYGPSVLAFRLCSLTSDPGDTLSSRLLTEAGLLTAMPDAAPRT